MTVKPSTEIRNLKRELSELREVCRIANIPLLVVYLPQLVLKEKRKKITKEEMKWAKEKIKEYKSKFINTPITRTT